MLGVVQFTLIIMIYGNPLSSVVFGYPTFVTKVACEDAGNKTIEMHHSLYNRPGVGFAQPPPIEYSCVPDR